MQSVPERERGKEGETDRQKETEDRKPARRTAETDNLTGDKHNQGAGSGWPV